MKEVRFGVIGCGGMAQSHMRYFGDIPNLKFVAAADVVPANVEKVVNTYGVQGFESGEKMLDSGLVDAVLIGTPHYFHPPFIIAAAQRNIHALTEKPVSVTAQAAQDVNAAVAKARAANPHYQYGAMFQNRIIPVWKHIKKLIQSGQLGRIQRMLWVATYWYRTDAYYASGSWRATWKGEGGGVLLNQCPHDLDMLCWLLGQPTHVDADLRLGHYHNIEVEDDVSARLRWDNGCVGTFIASTGEHPGTDYFEVIGEHGKIVKQGASLKFIENSVSSIDYSRNSEARMGGLSTTTSSYEFPTLPKGLHQLLTTNFVNAVLGIEPLVAPGEEGLESVELANAMIMSGIQQTPVTLPMNRPGYEQLLQQLIEKADAAKKA